MVDLAEGNVVDLTFPTDIANVKTGKNGNSIYGLNETGKQCEVKIRVLRGSDDDKFLNNLLRQQQSGFQSFPLLIGSFIKYIGDGTGSFTTDTYVMSGGVFTKIPEAKSNVEGDTEQSVCIYTMKFSNAPRSIGNG
jgi:hypothetical protein